jgi:hypothetical protein
MQTCRHEDTSKLTTPPRFHVPKGEGEEGGGERGEGVGWEATKSWDQRLYGIDLKEEQARRWEFGVCVCVCVCVCVNLCVCVCV